MLRLLAYSCLIVATFPACRDRDRTYDHERGSTLAPIERPAGVTTLTKASWVSADMATDRIVAARCAHELQCEDVGPDRHYPTPDACTLQLRHSMSGELSAGDCTDGVDGAGLDACVEAIRAQACTHRFEPVAQFPPCQSRALCASRGAIRP
jgi:hypothetical protein